MDKYGLIGYPLGHSFSISYFNEKFQNENIDAEYLNFDIPSIDGLFEVLALNPELKGLNVTIPHKQAVISLVEVLPVLPVTPTMRHPIRASAYRARSSSAFSVAGTSGRWMLTKMTT